MHDVGTKQLASPDQALGEILSGPSNEAGRRTGQVPEL